MFNIDKTSFGFKLTFSGTIDGEEMNKWHQASEAAVASAPESFTVFVDMRDLAPLTESAQVHMNAGQRLYREKGMQRSVVILASAVLTIQFKRIAKETGIYDWERYINAVRSPDWEEVGMKWLLEGIDPDAE